MHGIIFAELKKFVDTNYGTDAWPVLLEKAGLPARIYMPIETYDDQEVVQIVTTASAATGMPADQILESFGEFITPDLLKLYGAYINREWKTLDVLEHTEETIHRVVRSQNPGARPPELRVSRPAPDQAVIDYSSARKMCAVAKGITRGLAKHYKETVVIAETKCMHRGDPLCRITVRRQ